MLIEHYHPVPLPSMDDAKSPQVTPEVCQLASGVSMVTATLQVIHLYRRIIEVLPEQGKGEHLSVTYIYH